MAFQVPASKRSIAQNRFEFEVGGKTYSIPLMKFVPAGVMEQFENEKNITGLMMLADSDEQRDAMRLLEQEQIEALLSAWAEASDVSLGESSAS